MGPHCSLGSLMRVVPVGSNRVCHKSTEHEKEKGHCVIWAGLHYNLENSNVVTSYMGRKRDWITCITSTGRVYMYRVKSSPVQHLSIYHKFSLPQTLVKPIIGSNSIIIKLNEIKLYL